MSAPLVLRHRETFQAARTEVFAAWTEAGRLERWLAPSPDFRVVSAAADPRPGGRFALELASADGHAGRVEGTYVAVEPPARLELTMRVAWDGAPAPAGDGERVTVELDERDGRTELVLTHEGIAGEGALGELRRAWYGCFSRLPAALDASLAAFARRVTRFPRMHSAFGGLWPDWDDAEARIAGKEELGWLTAEDAARFRHWVEKGYVVLPGAVSADAIDRVLADVERAWNTPGCGLEIESFEGGQRFFRPIDPSLRAIPHKVLDLHGWSEAAREAVFAPAIARFLTQLFERPAVAFQSLLFDVGTEQDLHQDTAYVLVDSPMEFVGCWLALEDVVPGSGELVYREGSHRIAEYLWPGGTRAKPYDYREERPFLAWLREEPERLGLPLVRFLPKKGDAVIWHADLVHGGAPRTRRDATRRSLVTHFCPLGVHPEWWGAVEHEPLRRHGPGRHWCWRQRHA